MTDIALLSGQDARAAVRRYLGELIDLVARHQRGDHEARPAA